MDFNINKYEDVRFHEDELTHKRIKALLLWFEYDVYKHNHSIENQIELITRWLAKFIEQEYYEVLPFFEKLRIDLINKLNEPITPISHINTTECEEIVIVAEEKEEVSFLTSLGHKIRDWFSFIFKR